MLRSPKYYYIIPMISYIIHTIKDLLNRKNAKAQRIISLRLRVFVVRKIHPLRFIALPGFRFS